VLYNIGAKYEDTDKGVVETLKLLAWDVQWQGVPFTSPVRSAQATVTGPARNIRIVPFDLGNRHMPPYFQVFDENLQPAEDRKIPWRCTGRFDAGDTTVPGTYLCLQLFTEPRDLDYCSKREAFLILEPVEMDSGGLPRYKRVGLGRIWGEPPTFGSACTISLILV